MYSWKYQPQSRQSALSESSEELEATTKKMPPAIMNPKNKIIKYKTKNKQKTNKNKKQ